MIHIVFLPILIFLSGLFSASETALFSLGAFQRKKIQQSHALGAKYVTVLLDYPRRTLATILIGNMIVNVTAAGIATIITVGIFGKPGVIIAIVAMTLILLLFGELTPKTIALYNSETLCLFISIPLMLFGKIIFPFRWLLQKISGIFISFFTKYVPPQPFITEKELRAVVTLSKREGIINKGEEKMIHTIFEFGDRTVEEIMKKREGIVACDIKAKKDELINVMRKNRLNKIPIYENDTANIKGVVYTKEFMLNPKDEWASYIKKPLFVPRTETIDNLLVKFQSQRNYIAIIVDKDNKASGLVTLEDVLGEIAGKIRRETKSK